jgi:hypothetical protein
MSPVQKSICVKEMDMHFADHPGIVLPMQFGLMIALQQSGATWEEFSMTADGKLLAFTIDRPFRLALRRALALERLRISTKPASARVREWR